MRAARLGWVAARFPVIPVITGIFSDIPVKPSPGGPDLQSKAATCERIPVAALTGNLRPLLRLLREAPSAPVIDSMSSVADEECLVILGRIARTRPDLADAALAALDSVGSSRAVKIAAASRR